MKKLGKCVLLFAVLSLGPGVLAACGQTPTTGTTTPATTTTTQAVATTSSPSTIALGGRLYDDWIKTAGVATPSGNSTLWATQTTNKRSGKDTWRCKECHGWDYKGKDGVYGSGSHSTGFPGVYNAATAKTPSDIVSILKGSADPNHNFSSYLTADQISALAAFLKQGATVDVSQYIDSATKKPKSADAAKGKQGYDSVCAACHGADGKTINFGSASEPEFVGTVANDNPWEFVHKVRFGQPGTAMPAGIEQQKTVQDAVDILAHAQTLPDK